MGLFFGVFIPFVVGAELMDAWDERTTDPRLIKMRAQKKVVRKASILGLDPSELSEKASRKAVDTLTLQMEDMRESLHELWGRFHNPRKTENPHVIVVTEDPNRGP